MLDQPVDCPMGRIINATSTAYRVKALKSVVEGVQEPLASKPRVRASLQRLLVHAWPHHLYSLSVITCAAVLQCHCLPLLQTCLPGSLLQRSALEPLRSTSAVMHTDAPRQQ